MLFEGAQFMLVLCNQARSCKQTTEECRQILRSTQKLAEEGARTDAIPAVALDIFCHAAMPPGL